MRNSTLAYLASVLILFSWPICSASGEGDSINQTEVVGDGTTLVSQSGIFALGFFSGVGNSRYLGIWYTFSKDTVIWVANQRNPIQSGSSAVLELSGNGNLVINDTRGVVWTANSSSPAVENPVARLLDSGNLVVINGDDGGVVWQSFDQLSDSLIEGMKLGFDFKTGREWHLTAWKGKDDPSPSDTLLKMNTVGSREIYMTVQTQRVFRSGTWNGHWFAGVPFISKDSNENFTYSSNQTTAIFGYNDATEDVYSRLLVVSSGEASYIKWRKEISRWMTYWTLDVCDSYSKCGPNGLCGILQNSFNCTCFPGFRPRSDRSWTIQDFTLGCERVEELKAADCVGRGGEGFLRMTDLKTPDAENSAILDNIGLDECRDRCFENCSCVAYAPLYRSDISPRGCVMWFGDLVDARYLESGGQDLYLRSPAASKIPSKNMKTKITIIVVLVPMVSGLILLFIFGIIIRRRKMNKIKAHQTGGCWEATTSNDNNSKWKDEVQLFDFHTITVSTNNFSLDRKVGQGGFSSIYKGTLEDGQEIAVKRLSRSSRQRVDEFINEVTLISNLQHRNLVRLHGCCVDHEERLLIYEFMPNKSLDSFIFGESRHLLDWKKRAEIIIGIAKGLMYLHQDSQFRIIHRDLKAGNVLLDKGMNPKISDFGTARLFGEEQTEDNTRTIIGTYGYMSPEYAIGGIFSVKSDVFSFGVLLLEIISGKKIHMLFQDDSISLLEWAWMVWKDGKCDEFVDECLSQSCLMLQVMHYIKIGLLCVEENAVDRPTMFDVVLMLSNLNAYTPQPKQPAFCKGSAKFIKVNIAVDTINEVTLTEQEDFVEYMYTLLVATSLMLKKATQ